MSRRIVIGYMLPLSWDCHFLFPLTCTWHGWLIQELHRRSTNTSNSQKCIDLHGLGDVMWGSEKDEEEEEEEEKKEKEDEGETFFSAGVCIPPNNGGLENSSSTGQGPSQTWVATNTVSKQMALHDVIIICRRATKKGWSKQWSCHFPVERQNYGWHNRMAFDDGQKKHRWTKPCLYEGWAGWLARWMKAGRSGHIWTGKIKSWNPQADLFFLAMLLPSFAESAIASLCKWKVQ